MESGGKGREGMGRDGSNLILNNPVSSPPQRAGSLGTGLR